MTYPEPFETIWTKVKPFTMTSKNRGFALYEAVHYVLDNKLPGAFVECGVWRGGSSMLIALTLLERGVNNRTILMFDTFAGMTEPTAVGLDPSGATAAELLAKDTPDGWMTAACDLDTVRTNMLSTGYPRKSVGYIKGDVSQTLPHDRVKRIALLRLDTDFYDSTKVELEHLYPAAVPGAPVIIDDYGHWQGARKAVDEFLDQERSAGRSHFLAPLDYTGRAFIKPKALSQATGATSTPDITRHDYVSPGLKDIQMAAKFTHLERIDPRPVQWPYLRRDVPHIWRNDARSQKRYIGVLSADEGAVLHNAALPFKGKRALEIGCHLAFSTAHLAAAGLDLDVIDPMLADAAHRGYVQDSLDQAVPGHGARLHAGFSPGIVALVQSAKARSKWHFAFIDGLHDGTAPLEDARAVEPLMAQTAAVMFHDLTCPDVAEGLRHYANAGWETRIYNTMQVMGIAWRGNYTPPAHIPDTGTSTAHLDHLSEWQGEILQ